MSHADCQRVGQTVKRVGQACRGGGGGGGGKNGKPVFFSGHNHISCYII